LTRISNSWVWVIVIPLLIFGFIPFLISTPYLLHVCIMIIFYAIFSLSWGFLTFSGQLSLGHAAFLGLGCYTTAIFVKIGFPLLLAVVLAPFIALAAGLFIGCVCIRLKGWFLALATLSFTVILDPIFGSWDIAGRRGGIAIPSFFPSKEYFYFFQYYLFLIILLLTFFSLYLLLNSRLGAALSAIRQNELEAELAGINIVKYKLICFLISSFYAGLAGAIFAQYVGRITPTIFGFDYSLMPALMTIVGGIYSVWGPIVGAIVIVVLTEGLKLLPLYGLHVIRIVVVGTILILFVLFAPKGITPIIFNRLLRIKQFMRSNS
jgi:branched-chain amino acid transport system permease protein